MRHIAPRALGRAFVISVAVSAVLFMAAGGAPAFAQTPEEILPDAEAVTEPAAAPAGAPRLAPGEPIPAGELEAYLDALVAAAMIEHHIAGVSVSVVQGGEVLLAKGYGFADVEAGRRVDPDRTLFRIGSISKTFTWIEIMRLVESGRISLDDPVNAHLPPELQIPEQGFDTPIRVRDLMTHQPGFEDSVLGTIFAMDEADVRPLGRFLAEERPDRVREPGVFSTYSNYGAALAGAIVEHETGLDWQSAIERDILRPLGMDGVTGREPYAARDGLPAPMDSALAEDVSKAYRWAGVAHAETPFEYITQVAPAGAVSSTASDMARYMLMLLGGGELDGVQVFGPETAAAFRTPMTDLPPDVGVWAAGFFDLPFANEGIRAYGHDGATTAFFSSMMLAPELDLGIFITANTAGGAALTGPAPFLVAARFYGPSLQPALRPGDPELVKNAFAYAGIYVPTRRAYSGLESLLGRMNAATIAVTPDGYLVFSDRRYVPGEREGMFVAADGPGTLLFEMQDGRAVRILNPAMAFERASPLQALPMLGAVAAVALIAALLVWIGLFVRVGRGLPRTGIQTAAGAAQAGAVAMWFVMCLGVLLTLPAGANPLALVANYPSPPVLIASGAALAGALLTALTAVLLPFVWAGRGGWTVWRKLRFSVTTLVFAALSLMLLYWGALQPWNP